MRKHKAKVSRALTMQMYPAQISMNVITDDDRPLTLSPGNGRGKDMTDGKQEAQIMMIKLNSIPIRRATVFFLPLFY